MTLNCLKMIFSITFLLIIFGAICTCADENVDLFFAIISDKSGRGCKQAIKKGANCSGMTPNSIVQSGQMSQLYALYASIEHLNEDCAYQLIDCGADINFWCRHDITREEIAPGVLMSLCTLSGNCMSNMEFIRDKILPYLSERHLGGKQGLLEDIRNSVWSFLSEAKLPPAIFHILRSGKKEEYSFFTRDLGYSIESKDFFGWSLLHYAAWKGDTSSIRHLLDLHASPLTRTPDGLTCLHIAVMRSESALDALLDYDKAFDTNEWSLKDLLSTVDERGLTPLQLALLPPQKKSCVVKLTEAMREEGLFVPVLHESVVMEASTILEQLLRHQDHITPVSHLVHEVSLVRHDLTSWDAFAHSWYDLEDTVRQVSALINENGEIDEESVPKSVVESLRVKSEWELVDASTEVGGCWNPTETVHLASTTATGPRVQEIDATDLSPELFASFFYDLQRPVLITGNLSANMKLWQVVLNADDLLSEFGDIIIGVGNIPYGDTFGRSTQYQTLSEFVTIMQESRSVEMDDKEEPLIAFDGIETQRFLDAVEVPLAIRNVCSSAHRLFLEKPQFSLGAKGSGAPFHAHMSAFNTVFSGYKHWVLVAPGDASKLRQEEPEEQEEKSDIHSSLKNMKLYDNMETWSEAVLFEKDRFEADMKDIPYVEIVQGPGDVLFIPSNWAHSTRNLCETVAVAREFGCSDDDEFERLFVMPVMQSYGPVNR